MPWIVAAAKCGELNRARINIARQGFTPFIPERYDRRLKARRPLFGRYFFIQLGRDQRKWRAVHNTRGVQYVISNNGHWSFVPSAEMRELRSYINEHGCVVLPHERIEEDPGFVKGRPVKIKSGLLCGHIARCEGVSVRDQERLALACFGDLLIERNNLELLDEDDLADMEQAQAA